MVRAATSFYEVKSRWLVTMAETIFLALMITGLTASTPETLKEIIKHDEDDVVVQKMIRAQLHKMKKAKIVSY